MWYSFWVQKLLLKISNNRFLALFATKIAIIFQSYTKRSPFSMQDAARVLFILENDYLVYITKT
ncbi:hypothetical protein FLAVO9R_70366 [Flavobacterium sp. 9R]|nr:hypothetical protein FLAVO9R_70366 [Flavobacterium sp. 9R]